MSNVSPHHRPRAVSPLQGHQRRLHGRKRLASPLAQNGKRRAAELSSGGRECRGSLILLHGFGSSPAEVMFIGDVLRQRFPHLRVVCPAAPLRTISCYDGDRPRLPAWHDYFTDNGGAKGRPDLEERIDLKHVQFQRQRLHRIISQEAARYATGASAVVLGGISQGGCMSLDAAVTWPKRLGGVYCGHGQLYSVTSLPEGLAERELRVLGIHGDADKVLAPNLAKAGWNRLRRAGALIKTRVLPRVGHAEISDAEVESLARCLHDWLDLPTI